VEVHRPRGLSKNRRAGNEELRSSSRIVTGIDGAFGDGDVPGCVHETSEVAIRDRVTIHPETVHLDVVLRRFLGIVSVGAHSEAPFRNPHERGIAGEIARHNPRVTGGSFRLERIGRHPWFVLCTANGSMVLFPIGHAVRTSVGELSRSRWL